MPAVAWCRADLDGPRAGRDGAGWRRSATRLGAGRAHHQGAHQQGFTLIEVLIAVLVVSIGLLALAGLQMKAMTAAHSSYMRSVAAIQATDLVERAWADICRLTGEKAPNPNDDFGRIVDDWAADNRALLPDWTHAASLDPSSGELVVTVRWTEPRLAGGVITESFSYATRLPRLLCGAEESGT